MASDKVRFRVGEQVFCTSRSTIANGGRDTHLAAMTDSLWRRPVVGGSGSFSDESGDELFIDRNPAYFSVLLDLLRTGVLRIPSGMSATDLMEEASYYGLQDQVRAAKTAPLDGNTLERTATVRGSQLPASKGFIRANSGGGCCVARRSMARVYDWTLQQRALLNLDFAPICDMTFMGTRPERVLIGTEAGDDAMSGGLACLDVSSGEVVHRYELDIGGEQFQSFSCHAIATGDGGHVFTSCFDHRHGMHDGVLVLWDGNTGQQIQHTDLVSDVLGARSVHYGYEHYKYERCKLQWLPEYDLLLVTSTSFRHGSYVYLFYPRSGEVVWRSSRGSAWVDAVLMDAVAVDHSTLWVADDFYRLGFADMRASRGLDWTNFPGASVGLAKSDPRLAIWGSQMFASRNDEVYVLSSREWQGGHGSTLETGMVKTIEGANIADIAVGGDRLFVLHSEAEIVEVWETPVKRGTCNSPSFWG